MTATTRRHFPLFDSLRAIAALSIFAYHVLFVTGQLRGDSLTFYLNTGVPLFFLISGFLLYRPFVARRVAGASRPESGPYAVRRALRIVPAYWVALTIVTVLLGIGAEVFTPRGVLTYYGFLQVYDLDTLTGGIGPAWTIDIEVTFYIFLPVWAWLMRRVRAASPAAVVRSELWGIGGLIAFSTAWKVVTILAIGRGGHFTPVVLLLPAALDQFALGMGTAVASVALAERARQPRLVRAIDRAPWACWLVAALAYLLLGVFALPSAPLAGTWGVRLMFEHWLQAIVALGILLPAVFGDPSRGAVRRVLGDRRLLWVGMVSYALYLWHLPILEKAERGGWSTTLGTVPFAIVCLAITLVIAAASWYGLERHCLALGRRYTARRRRRAAARSAAAAVVPERVGEPTES